MPTTKTTEKDFQEHIINHLVSTGYHKRKTINFNKAICTDPKLILKFIQDSQPKEWKKFPKESVETIKGFIKEKDSPFGIIITKDEFDLENNILKIPLWVFLLVV